MKAMTVQKDKPTQLAVIYRKTDGKIVRVSTLTPNIIGKITESDLDKFLPGVDLTDFAMVFIQGKQYLDIEKYRVDINAQGTFLNIIEKMDVLSSFEENTEVTKELLDREANIVISVLGVIDDKDRLAKYKELEERGLNRVEVMNFFKQRGI